MKPSPAPLLSLLLSAAVLSVSGAAASGARAAVPIMPIDEVRPGMQGTARTVLQGDSVAEFGIEIVSVMKRARPQGDLILFRGLGPTLEHIGIVAGMSGSPVYIDGRLVGAIAFSYPLSKDPVGGITPIGEMLDILRLAPEKENAPGEKGSSRETGSPGRAPVRNPTPPQQPGSTGISPEDLRGPGVETFERSWESFLRRESPEGSADREQPVRPVMRGTGGLEALALPLSMSGWASELGPEIERGLEGFGFSGAPAAGGAPDPDARSSRPEKPLEPGSAVGVSLISGDASLGAIGTLTYVDGDRLLAFGHPMIQAGPVSLPLSRAWIHTIMANLETSFKMGTPTSLVGTIWEDRRPGVAATVDSIPPMLPVRVTLRSPDGGTRTFRYGVVRNQILTPLLLPWTVANSYLASGWAQGDAEARSETTVHFNGNQEVKRTERFQTDAPGTALATEIILPANLLLINPFSPTRLDSISVGLSYDRENVEANLTEARCERRRVAVGDTVTVWVKLEPFRREPEFRRFDFAVPGGWEGKKLVIIAAGAGEMMDLDRDRAPEKLNPRSLPQLLDLISGLPNDGDLLVRVAARGQGSVVKGIEVPALPPSVVAAGTSEGEPTVVRTVPGSTLLEQRVATPWVVRGREVVEVEVEP
jgi:hypothetical protein